MQQEEIDKWVRRVAAWLPRLIDSEAIGKATEALLEISSGHYNSRSAASFGTESGRTDFDSAQSQLYQRDVLLLEPTLADLIPAWIQRLIELRRRVQADTDARVVAIELDTKVPTIGMVDILAAGHLQRALNACGERIAPYIGPIAAALNTLGRHGDDELASVLSYAGPAITLAKPALLQLLEEHGVWSSPSGIRAAIVQLAAFDPSVIDHLKVMLHAPTEQSRQAAANILGSLGNAGGTAQDDLLAMGSAGGDDRCAALYALAAQSPATPALLEFIAQSLQETDGYVRRAAGYAAGELQADPSRFVPLLISACDDQDVLHDTSLPEAAVRALKDYGPAALAALPRLRRFLDGPIIERTVKPAHVREAIAAIANVPTNSAEDFVGIRPIAPVFNTENTVPLNEPIFRVMHRRRLCYVDRSGSVVLGTIFARGEPFQGDRAIVHSESGTFVIDRSGATILKSKWRSIKPFHEGLAAIKP